MFAGEGAADAMWVNTKNKDERKRKRFVKFHSCKVLNNGNNAKPKRRERSSWAGICHSIAKFHNSAFPGVLR